MSDEVQRGSWPQVFWLAQHTSSPAVVDRATTTAAELARLDLGTRVEPGQHVAIAVGSRGITGLDEVVRATVAHLRSLGAEPFVVPAMGSHGGATPDGQTDVLAGYGITADLVGAPVRSQMGVVDLGRPLDFPVFFDRLAAEADHVVIVNRIKPHTMFEGSVESGLAKMLMIGLGKGEGAGTYHAAEWDHGWMPIVEAVVPHILDRVNLLAAVAIVENHHDETAAVEAVDPADLLAAEARLLKQASGLLPRLPFADSDVCLIDEIGKDLSGSGFDVNVVGRKGSFHEPRADLHPRIRTIIVRGLSPGTHGNAHGVGLAELCRTRVLEQMDRDATWVNAMTSGDLAAGMAPVNFETDRQLLDAAQVRNGLRSRSEMRLIWIRNTLDVDRCVASVAHLDEARSRQDLEVLSEPLALPLDPRGNLPDQLPPDPPGAP